MTTRKVAYIWDSQLIKQCNKIPVIKQRASKVHCLIRAYGLLPHLVILPSKPASHKDLCRYHDKEYVDFLRLLNKKENIMDDKIENLIEKFGLAYDCAILYRMYNFARVIGGGTLQAAQCLVEGIAQCAINWCGGWHHAQRSEASGFCYINDIVLAIFKLLDKFSRVLYIDLDVHHGNGVEAAFCNDRRVLTLSLHLYEAGFYPCSGSLEDVGCEDALYYTVNVPLRSGLTDKNFNFLFTRISSEVYDAFRPEAVVVQCGADGLTKDPLGSFSLTLTGIGSCVEQILTWETPTLFLGGGGYSLSNTARLWTYLTSLIVGKSISNDIPDHKFFLDYGEDYELHITPGQREDLNKPEYIEFLVNTIIGNVQHIR